MEIIKIIIKIRDIKKIYSNDANEVWLESIEKQEYPDGTIDYMTIMFAHDDDISDLFVGKRIKKNEIFYKEGTKGNSDIEAGHRNDFSERCQKCMTENI